MHPKILLVSVVLILSSLVLIFICSSQWCLSVRVHVCFETVCHSSTQPLPHPAIHSSKHVNPCESLCIQGWATIDAGTPITFTLSTLCLFPFDHYYILTTLSLSHHGPKSLPLQCLDDGVLLMYFDHLQLSLPSH